jgi:hypothetical protein
LPVVLFAGICYCMARQVFDFAYWNSGTGCEDPHDFEAGWCFRSLVEL